MCSPPRHHQFGGKEGGGNNWRVLQTFCPKFNREKEKEKRIEEREEEKKGRRKKQK